MLFIVPMFYKKYDDKVDAFVENAMTEIKKLYDCNVDLCFICAFICASSLYNCIFIYPLCFMCFNVDMVLGAKKKEGEKDVKFGSHNWVTNIFYSVRIILKIN